MCKFIIILCTCVCVWHSLGLFLFDVASVYMTLLCNYVLDTYIRKYRYLHVMRSVVSVGL